MEGNANEIKLPKGLRKLKIERVTGNLSRVGK